MVRTRDTASVKVSGGKATRKISNSDAMSSYDKGSASDKNNKYSGGNPYCPRETPAWQKSITCFFPASSDDDNQANGEASNSGRGSSCKEVLEEQSDNK
ncbi:PCNA-associated factor-like [Lycorma delicatula]|uniref:PCNA-associated factor-like n=1 Tax=Lycorma delicatula TaxID=130591 RepID=UPI003F5189D5